MFRTIVNAYVGIGIAGMGVLIAIKGGYYDRYGYFRDYGELATPAGVILIVIGVVIVVLALWEKKPKKQQGSNPNDWQSNK